MADQPTNQAHHVFIIAKQFTEMFLKMISSFIQIISQNIIILYLFLSMIKSSTVYLHNNIANVFFVDGL